MAHSLYTIRSAEPSAGAYRVMKMDQDFNAMEVYWVSEIGPTGATMICTCPAGGKPTCRHRSMLRIFQAEDKVNKFREAYNYDKKIWVKLPDVGEV